jgi:hypothetical protein
VLQKPPLPREEKKEAAKKEWYMLYNIDPPGISL